MCVIVLLAALAPVFDYLCKQPWAAYNWAYLLLAVALGTAVAVLSGIRGSKSPSKDSASRATFPVIVALGTVLLFVLQLFIVDGAFFKTGWDVSVLTDYENTESYLWYYSRYPNQLFLAGLFSKIARLGAMVGLSDGYRCVVLCGCILVSLCAPMVACIGRKLGGSAVGYCSFFIFFAFIGCSPWILVPYSDTYAMPFTCAALFAYACVRNKPAKWFVVVFASLVGYFIKPTAIFALLAILIVEAIEFVARRRKAKPNMTEPQDEKAAPKRRVGMVVSCLVSIGIALALALACSQVIKLKIDINEDESFGVAHYLMMGFNPERMGIYAPEDSGFSESFATTGERTAGDIARWRDRVGEMGPIGIAKLFLDKTLINYADGTFAWKIEGNFFIDTSGQSEPLKSMYGIDDAKDEEVLVEREPLFVPFAQVVWMFLLVGVALGLLKKRPTRQECVMSLALLMLTGFLLLFECRARYLLLYAPYFVVMGMLGWQALSAFVRERTGAAKRGLHAR